jgi:hypothetical protein
MANKRYKVTKEQLERVVENFVMESAMNTGKAPVKNMIPKQGPEAKKYVKNKISGGMVDQSENMPSVSPMKKKLSQAPEAKKYMAKGKTSYMSKPKTTKGNSQKLDEGIFDMIFGDSENTKKQKLMDDVKQKNKVWSSKGVDKMSDAELIEFMNQAEADNYNGVVGVIKNKIVYKPASQVKWGAVGGHVFGAAQN